MNLSAVAHVLPQHNRQKGLSLVELMISLTIGLILLVGLTTLIVQQSSARDELEKSSRQIENGRYALQILRDDVEHAGYYGTYTPASGVVYTTPPDPCLTALGSANSGWDTSPVSVPAPIYGYSGAAANPMAATTCGLSFYKPNTAILVVRRTVTGTVATAVAGATYLQVSECNTDPSAFVYGTGGFARRLKDCVSPAPLNPYIVDIYYISTCDVCGSDTIPTLKMVQSGPTAAPAAPIPLVEGIEDMQFDYGIDNTGIGAPDTFSATPALGDWPNVMSVRVNVLARNIECTTGYTDTKTYTLGSSAPASAPPSTCTNGGYRRHVYSELVRAINPSGWREKP